MPYRTAAKIEEAPKSQLEIKALELAERLKVVVGDFKSLMRGDYGLWRLPEEDRPHLNFMKSEIEQLLKDAGFSQLYHCHLHQYRHFAIGQYNYGGENCLTYFNKEDSLVLLRRHNKEHFYIDLHRDSELGTDNFMYACFNADDLIKKIKRMRWNPKRNFHDHFHVHRREKIEDVRERSLKIHVADALMTVVRNAEGR